MSVLVLIAFAGFTDDGDKDSKNWDLDESVLYLAQFDDLKATVAIRLLYSGPGVHMDRSWM